jgi:hypothetical protein
VEISSDGKTFIFNNTKDFPDLGKADQARVGVDMRQQLNPYMADQMTYIGRPRSRRFVPTIFRSETTE